MRFYFLLLFIVFVAHGQQQVNEKPFAEIGYQYTSDMHGLRVAILSFYATFNIKDDGPKEGKYDVKREFVAGYIYRWMPWFSLFGGVGFSKSQIFYGFYSEYLGEYIGLGNPDDKSLDFRLELGTQLIYKYFSVYFSLRNPASIGVGTGLVFYPF
jgi:hypothetical protein